MAEKHELAKVDYIAGMKYKDIAEKYQVSYETVKSWRKRHGWQRQKSCTQRRKKTAPEKKKGARTKVEKGCTGSEKKTTALQVAYMESEENEKLTERQRLFCIYFVNNRNATQAAIRAGYSKDTARMIGYENLTKPYIRNEVERLKAMTAQAIMFGPEDIVEKYMRIAFAQVTDVTRFGMREHVEYDKNGAIMLDEEGNVKTYKTPYLEVMESDEVDGGLISEVSLGRQGLKVKMLDQQKALEWLSNYFNMNPMSRHKQQYDNAVLELRRQEMNNKEW